MKKKPLSFHIEAEQFMTLQENRDFHAMLQIGRMLNAFELTTEVARDLLNDRNSHKMHISQASTVLSRLATEAMNLTRSIAPWYGEAAFFDHLREMFTAGGVRYVEYKPLSKVVPPEFQLYSADPAVSELLREFDISGHGIVFPQNHIRIADDVEGEGETHYQLGKYEIRRPKERVDRQLLRVMITFVQDFTEGATKFIQGVAEKVKLGNSRPQEKKRSLRATTWSPSTSSKS